MTKTMWIIFTVVALYTITANYGYDIDNGWYKIQPSVHCQHQMSMR